MMKHGPTRDPFGERVPIVGRRRYQLLGCRFEFASNDTRLLSLVDAAYRGLPPQRLPGAGPAIRVQLRLTSDSPGARWRTPPEVRTHGAAGLVGAVVDAANFAVLSPATRSALVVISPRMLAAAYYARYELLEFCVFTLASRCQGLIPLHGAAVGRGPRCALLLGASGAGKSTLVLHALTAGCRLLSEDAIFVAPRSLQATGVPGFVHLRADALRWLHSPALRSARMRAAFIRRRSGVRKLELDLRRTHLALARRPMRVAVVIFLSAKSATPGRAWRSLSAHELRRRLKQRQPFAAAQPAWREFLRNLQTVPAYELRRQPSPQLSAGQLHALLGARAAKMPG